MRGGDLGNGFVDLEKKWPGLDRTRIDINRLMTSTTSHVSQMTCTLYPRREVCGFCDWHHQGRAVTLYDVAMSSHSLML